MIGIVASWLEQQARMRPQREAIVDLVDGRSLTYARLWRRVRSLAHSLESDYGVAPGDRVAILSRNDGRVFETIYACGLLGAIAVPLNWRLTVDELSGITVDAAPTLLIHETSAAEVARDVATSTGCTLLGWSTDRQASADEFELAASQRPPSTWLPPEVREDAVWTIIYTSGTTGLPKGVQATHRAVLASMLGIIVAHGVSAETRSLTVLPTFHVAGLNLFANPTLFAGGTVLVAQSFEPAPALRLLRDDEPAVTHFCGVPANYQFMEQLPEFDHRPLRPFTAVVGGSPVPLSLVATWRERGVDVRPVYGITEAGACLTGVATQSALGASSDDGFPVLLAACRIHDDDGVEVEPDAVGELQISGDVVTSGYWRNPQATAEAFTSDGWLHTGDAASMSADGVVRIVDRWKDMYISGGENVYPAEVENVLVAHSDVAQAAVVGTPDEKWGEVGVAFVIPAAGATLDPRTLSAWCSERLARYKLPTTYVIVDDFPRNATGKTLKRELRRTFGG